MAAGRPTKYKPEYCQQVIAFMSEGKDLRSFAAKIGHHHQTLYEWARDHKDFGDALNIARDAAFSWWEEMGMQGMLGQIKNFNATVWVFSCKNRFGWRDVIEQKVGVHDTFKDYQDEEAVVSARGAQSMLDSRNIS